MLTSPAFRTGLSSAVALALLPLLPTAAFGQKEENPIVAHVKKSLKDPAKPFTLLVHLQVKDGMQEKLEAAFVKASKGTRKEKGSLIYELSHDTKDPTRYLVYERWKSLADLDEHLKTPHITALLAELKELLAVEPDVKVLLPAGE